MWKTNENNHPPPTTGTKAQLLGDSKWRFSQPAIQQGRQRIARLALLPSIWSFSSPPLYLHALSPASQKKPKTANGWAGWFKPSDAKIQRFFLETCPVKDNVWRWRSPTIQAIYLSPTSLYTFLCFWYLLMDARFGVGHVLHLDFSHFHSPRIHQRLEKPC